MAGRRNFVLLSYLIESREQKIGSRKKEGGNRE